jgi:hypothetical protein
MTGVTTHGGNVVSDTDSTDDLGTTGVRWRALYVDAITATDQITATGFTGTLDGILGSGTAAAATTTTLASTTITASGIIKTDDTTAATNTTDGSLQTDGGLSVAADAVIGDDLFMLSDAAVITFGADKDVTLTHVADTGLLLNGTSVIQFNDASQNIGAPSATVLDINATDEIELNATLVDVNANLDVSGTGVIAGDVTTAALTASGIIKTDDTTAATSTTDGSLQTDGGLSVVLDAVIGDDLILLSDAAVIHFGADSDVTLTHVADTGLLLNGTSVIQFNDASQSIGAPSNAILDINATDEIELNATLVDVNANLDVSGTYTGGGTMTTGGSIVIPNAGNIGSAGDTDSIAIASNGVVTFSQAPVFPDGSIAVADLDIDGATDIGAALVDADLFIVDDGAGGTNRKSTLARLKTYMSAGSTTAADDIDAGDAAVLITTSSGNITIDAAANDSDIIIKGTDGGADTTFLTIDGSAAGEATFNAGIVMSTIVASGIIKTDDTTAATSTTDGSLQTDGGLSVVLDAVIGDDLFMLSDAAVVTFGADKDVTLTHVADTGLLLNAAMVVQFRDSAINIGSPADGDLDINADDEIELNSTLIDINGNLDVSGTGVIAGAVTTAALTASGIIKTDDSTAATSTTDGSLQTDGGLSVVLDAVIGDDVILISDAAQIAFGVNSEITLAHVHNVGLTLTHVTAGDNLPVVLQLKSEEDIVVANEVIASIEFAAGDSDGTDGATVAAGIHAIAEDTFSASANATKLVFTTGVSETAASSATAKATLSSIGDFTVAGDLVIKDGGTIGSASDLDAIAIASDGVVTMNQIPVFSAGINVSSGTIAGTLSTAAQGNVTSLGTLTALTVDNIIINGANIGHTSDTDSIAIASNGVVTFSQAPVFPDGSIAVADLDIDGATDIGAAVVDADLFIIDDGAGGTNRKVTAARIKTYTNAGVSSAADDISAGDAAVVISTSSGNITIDAAANDSDIILKGTDGGADTTFLTIDGSAAGEATFNAGIVIADAGTIGSASDKDAIAIGSDGDVTLTQDLELQHDGAILSFGADDDVTLTHVHNAGVMFNAAMQLRFRDSAISIGSAADGDLDINADDEIELNSTLIDINGNLDVSGTGVIAGALTSAAFTASGIIKTDDTTAATSTTDGSLQTDGGLSVTLDAVIGDDLFMLSDAAVVTFGAGKDVTLTHVHDTGLLLNAAMVMQFRDSAINIGSPADGDLDINADDEIELNSTLIDINGAVDISGATTVGGILKTDDTTAATNTTDGSLQTDGGLSVAADAVIGDDLFMLSDAAVVTFGADKDVTLTHVHNTGILLNSTNVIQFNDASQNIGAPSATVLDINATDEIELNATLVDINANVEISGNLTVAGTTTQVDTVTMNAANAVVFEGATADAHETTLTIVDPTGDRTINLPNVSGTIPVLAAASTTQITSTPAELNILDGATVVVGEINALDIGSTAVGTAVASKAVILDSSKDYTGIRNLTISGEIDAATGDYSGAVDIAGATTTAAITASGIIKTDDTTAATSTTDGSLQTDGGLSVTLDAVIGDDLFMLSDAAVVTFGANKDVTLTHVHNTGLLLNAAMVMQFRDSAINIGSPADGDLDINADDEIELNSTLIDVNGNLDVSGTGVIAGAVTTAALTASGIIKTDDTTAATSTTDGSLQTDGGLSVTLDAVIGDDLFMLSDAAVVTFGANKDVTLTHVHNTGLLLNAAMVVQFRDSAINIGSPADGDLDINADDEIELNSTLIDINGNLDVSGTGVIAGAVTTAALTASGIIKTDDTTAATSTTDGSLQTDGGLSVAADAVIGDDLFMLSDAAVVTFGADKDVTLTHVADTGLLLNAAMVVQFRDSAINIGSPADGDLDINADDEIELNSTLIDVNGNLDVSGTIVGAGAITGGGLMTTGGNIVIPNAGNIGSAGDTDSIAIASNGVVTFSQAPVFPDGSIAVADLDIDGATDIGAAIVDADLFIVDDGAGGTNRKTTAARLKTYIDAASAPVQLLIKDVDDAVIAIRVGLASGGTDVEIQNSAGTALKSMTGAFTSADAALAA